ncbi:hypothetical protein AYI70_g8477 [Smittium culicis]|uniref:Uncharacterized protein n=1 Tax=Smittium culicis TaxID=133412 RepID=A0A1R1XFQ5_9FUNG|nr:hypothetical protein AYI70_g8477 [Smittium culicis]
MSYGISNCGTLALWSSFEQPELLRVQVQLAPKAKEYWCLIVIINDELDKLYFCWHKVVKAEACYTNIKRLLSLKSVPMVSKVIFLLRLLEARVRYGVEIKFMFR